MSRFTYKQPVVAMSSTAAESSDVSDGCRDRLTILYFLKEFVQVKLLVTIFMQSGGNVHGQQPGDQQEVNTFTSGITL